uniref:DUF4283 domain-containing protein n=1 Tax=Populus alba TaxID=43335 RepID=A0A4V6A8F7_POPAL|nr:hypothetical protein D5086_0000159560 [Populus alba]
MAKSKKKSSVLRSTQQDYDYCSSGIHHTPSATPQLSSPCCCGLTTSSPVSTQPRYGPLGELVSPNPWFGVGNPNLEAMTGAAASPPPHMLSKASTESHKPSSPVCPIGTPIVPQSPPLVHFSTYTATSSCTFLDTDLGTYKDRWRFDLIGFIAGKFPGYTSLSTFVNNSWKCNVNFSMHDSGWLIFNFDSEMDMLEVLNRGPYYVHDRLLILKIMPELFDFDTSDMVQMPCKTLGHNTSSCANNSSHKCKKHAQTTPTPSGCSNPSTDTEVVEKQPLWDEPQGETEFDPMSTEAAWAKLATPTGPLGDHPPGSPSVVPVSEDDTTAELLPKRQYLTRSKVVATSDRSGKASWKSHPSNNSSLAETQHSLYFLTLFMMFLGFDLGTYSLYLFWVSACFSFDAAAFVSLAIGESLVGLVFASCWLGAFWNCSRYTAINCSFDLQVETDHVGLLPIYF